MNEFDNWYKGDLIYNEICDECIPPEMLRKWMMACWNAAIDAAINTCWLENEIPDMEKLKIS